MSVISLISMAIAAPSPIDTPTSATAKAGASLTPSPQKRTYFFSRHITKVFGWGRFRLPTKCNLSSGRSCEWTAPRGIPISRATARAGTLESPVAMMVSIPAFLNPLITARASSRTASLRQNTPMIPSWSVPMNPTLPTVATQLRTISFVCRSSFSYIPKRSKSPLFPT